MKAIEVANASYVYPDGSVGVRDASLSIERGERVALLGANGSGKSTLLLLMAGLLKPSSGEVKIFGMKPEKENIEEIRRRVGVVFQNPDEFLFNPTVRDELLYVPRQLELGEDELEEKLSRMAGMFGIEDLLDKPPFRLSGGEKKKVEIASVLIYEPEVLLLDEPTANVDGRTRRFLLKILEEYDGTIIVATHELDIARRLAGKVVLMNLDHSVEAVGGKELLEDLELLERVGVI